MLQGWSTPACHGNGKIGPRKAEEKLVQTVARCGKQSISLAELTVEK
jgi:hypothetical protein